MARIGGNYRYVVTEHREIPNAFRFGAHHRKRGGGSGGLEADGKKHYMLVGIETGKFQRISRRIDDADIHPARLVLERTTQGPGNAHHVAEGRENYIGLLRNRQTIVNASHGKDAYRAARPVNQFDIFRKNIFQPEAIDCMGVTTANFHHAVMALAAGQTPNLVGGPGNQFGFAELINISHAGRSLAIWSRAGVN